MKINLSAPALLVAALPFLWIAAGMTAELSRAGSGKVDRAVATDRIDAAFEAIDTGAANGPVPAPLRFITTETRERAASVLLRTPIAEAGIR